MRVWRKLDPLSVKKLDPLSVKKARHFKCEETCHNIKKMIYSKRYISI